MGGESSTMPTMSTLELRRQVLEGLGARDAVLDELLAYNRSTFDPQAIRFPLRLPLVPAPHVAAWRDYAARAGEVGGFAALREALVQLRFPIVAGISGTDDYRGATLRGVPVELPGRDGGLVLERPDEVALAIHEAPAGPLPVVSVPHRADFVALVRALAMRNEPAPVPPSMGAVTVRGLNNWDRIRRLRTGWEEAHPEASADDWQAHFRSHVVPCKDLYQDIFVILSRGEYSHVDAADLGLDPSSWLDHSARIRRDHECSHYFTLRLYGSIRNRFLDEVVCDFAGLVSSLGRYRADWFLRFMGLEDFPRYRSGGRFENYLGSPPLSEEAQAIEQAVLRQAALQLEAFDARHPFRVDDIHGLGLRLLVLTRFSLEELADTGVSQRLEAAWEDLYPLVEC